MIERLSIEPTGVGHVLVVHVLARVAHTTTMRNDYWSYKAWQSRSATTERLWHTTASDALVSRRRGLWEIRGSLSLRRMILQSRVTCHDDNTLCHLLLTQGFDDTRLGFHPQISRRLILPDTYSYFGSRNNRLRQSYVHHIPPYTISHGL